MHRLHFSNSVFDAVESAGCTHTSLFSPAAHRGQHANKTHALPSFSVVSFLRKQFIGFMCVKFVVTMWAGSQAKSELGMMNKLFGGPTTGSSDL